MDFVRWLFFVFFLIVWFVAVFWSGYSFIDAEAKVIFTILKSSIIKFIENKLKIEFSLIGSALIAIIGLKFFLHRLEKQEDQIDLQRKQRTDERFTTAVNLLGSKTSARTGAIYSLYHLTIEEKNTAKK